MYLTYETYQSMGGTLTETAFNDFEFEAECLVNWYTFNRLIKEKEEDYPAALPRLMYRLIKLAVDKANILSLDGAIRADGTIGNPAVIQQENDGVMVRYNTISADELFSKLDKQMSDIITNYLHGVTNSLGRKLLYRGIYPNE